MLTINGEEYNQLVGIVASQRLSVVQAKTFVKGLRHFEEHHGLPQLVSRLKELRAGFLAGDLSKFRRHKNGDLYGTWRILSSLVRKDGRRGRICVDRILRIYTRWIHDEPDLDDYIDHQISVDVEEDDVVWGLTIPCEISYTDVRLAEAAFEKSELPRTYDSTAKRVPLTELKEYETPPHRHLALLSEHCPSIMWKYRELFADIYPFEGGEATFSQWRPTCTNGDVVGEVVGLVKDGGLKLRFIANPHRALQWALTVLKTTLSHYLAAMPESCVFDQQSALPWIQRKLHEGNLWSLDLSSATDRFPLSYQVKLLKQLFPMLSRDIDMWVDISRALWRTKAGYTRYGTGQPMGLGPSFSAFTIAHIHLLRSLGGKEDDFRVIGDDVVIADAALAYAYRQVMLKWNVEVSMTKSLIDKPIAEIAGRIIDRHGVWPTYKGRASSFAKDPLGLLRQYGPKILPEYPSDLQKVVSLIAELPHPWGLAPETAIEELPPELVYELYQVTVENQTYPDGGRFGLRAQPWMFVSTTVPKTDFEQENPDSGIKLTVGSSNDPLLSQHLNAVLKSDGFLPPILETIGGTLDDISSYSAWEDKTRLPIASVRALYKRVTRYL